MAIRQFAPPANPFVQLLATSDNRRDIHAIVETPKSSRHKYKYDETPGSFKLERVLNAGLVFPFNFGYIPSSWCKG